MTDDKEALIKESHVVMLGMDELFDGHRSDAVIYALAWSTAMYIRGTVSQGRLTKEEAFKAVFSMICTAYSAQGENDDD